MNAIGYNVIAALAVVGSVVSYVATQDTVVPIALIGLAGTIAGRGSKGDAS